MYFGTRTNKPGTARTTPRPSVCRSEVALVREFHTQGRHKHVTLHMLAAYARWFIFNYSSGKVPLSTAAFRPLYAVRLTSCVVPSSLLSYYPFHVY